MRRFYNCGPSMPSGTPRDEDGIIDLSGYDDDPPYLEPDEDEDGEDDEEETDDE